ncbi:MAG: cobalamin-dependent protein [Actinobacteria bacterium]|nr:cobalamin-dependent protein [Actinomycetota bacterium]
MLDEATILERLSRAVMDGDEDAATQAANDAVGAGMDPQRAIMEGLAAGMAEMGRLYEEGECYVPELMVSSEALYAGLAILRPLVVQSASGAIDRGVAVIGAVQGDIHDIGKNLVKMMLEVSGLAVHDLGRDVEMDAFIDECMKVKADLLCLSALMTTTIIAIKDYLPVFKAKLPGTKIMIGGAPLNQRLADEWGADGYGENAMEAARVAIRLLEG